MKTQMTTPDDNARWQRQIIVQMTTNLITQMTMPDDNAR
jgi:hypothetical protein